MYAESEEFSNEGENGAAREHITVLAVCLAGANELGRSLQVVLQPVRNIKLLKETLPKGDLGGCQPMIGGFLERFRPGLVLLCLSGDMSGSEIVFQAICNRGLSVIGILETGAPEELSRFIDMGAVDFSLAPLRLDDLIPRILRWSTCTLKTNPLARHFEQSLGLQQFLGTSPPFIDAIKKIPKIAKCDASVFITGETGTGKEMCARAIHHLGPRADHPFVPVNCGAIPSELVENELFGHEAGAFTGASSTVRGLVYEAEGGTVFLDEIDSLPLHTQVKFLRFLQDQEYRPLGAGKTRKADVRVIAASNADLEAAVRGGRFRSDLFYRLNILPLNLPPLRDRREDIPLLARHFLAKYARESSTQIKELPRSALDKLLAHQWPGNVRELENVIERAVVLSELPIILVDDICLPENGAPSEETSFKSLKARAIKEFETAFVRQMLIDNDGNISKAARAAKKNRRAFWQLMRKHHIRVPARSSTPQVDRTNACEL